MTTTVYQKFVSKYAETFTLIEITDGVDYVTNEIVPAAKVAQLDEDGILELLEELRDSRNEKASWSDDEDTFNEEDKRAAYHQKWDEIDSNFDNMGI